MNSSHHCLLTGQYTTLGALTRGKKIPKRRLLKDRPTLPKAPRRMPLPEKRRVVKRILFLLYPRLHTRKNLRKLWHRSAFWTYANAVADTVNLPRCDMRDLLCGEACPTQCERFVTLIERALRSPDA